jgi:hypothetical protein
MNVKVQANYVVPIVVDDSKNINGRTSQAIEKALQVIREIEAESIKLWIMSNLSVVYPD